MVKNRMRALLTQHGMEPPPVSDLFGKKGLSGSRRSRTAGARRMAVGEDVELAETLKGKIRATEGLIEELAEGDEAVGWLRTLPGVGEFFSVLIRHEVGEMDRFPSPKKFASYTGLVPSTYASERGSPTGGHQGGQQVAEVGVRGSGEPGDPPLAVPARLLHEDQG